MNEIREKEEKIEKENKGKNKIYYIFSTTNIIITILLQLYCYNQIRILKIECRNFYYCGVAGCFLAPSEKINNYINKLPYYKTLCLITLIVLIVGLLINIIIKKHNIKQHNLSKKINYYYIICILLFSIIIIFFNPFRYINKCINNPEAYSIWRE